jgi:twitching motility protein PilT
MIKEKNGIIFVTGATGMGKTTTLAAMLNELNQTQHIHIITLEDPIEFLHQHHRAIFHQRELGKDFPDFARGLRAALRQAPKVILVGEVRDRETMEIAMTASETGHVVFATLHTINAGQSIKRILGMFGKEEEQLLRQRLAETVRYIVSQRLVNKIGGGRHLVTEIMGSNLSTREAITYGEKEDRSFQDIIEASKAFGWHSFDQELITAYENGLITQETAVLHCTLKNKMRRDLETVNNRSRAHIDEPSGLNLDPTAIKRPSEAAHV